MNIRSIQDIENIHQKCLFFGGGILLSLGLTNFFMKKLKNSRKQKAMEQKIRNRQLELNNYLDNLIIPDSMIDSDLQEQILNSSVQEIKTMLDERLFSSEQLLNLYTQRALDIGRKLNIITDICYEDSLLQARECDTMRKEHPEKCVGELYGVVMSIKESFHMKNYHTTIGCGFLADKIDEEDGAPVQVLKNAGAIIFMQSNVCQGLMTHESINNIYGESFNSWDKTRTCGGSSGGEGAAIGARISPLGLGSDIGGSIRTPCSFNGITGLKPTAQRLSWKGHFMKMGKAFEGQISILCSIGPMGKYVSDINLAMGVFMNEKYYENIPKINQDLYNFLKPWNQELANSKKKFKIGYFKSLNRFPACVSSQRAVQESVEILKKQGHEVVEIVLPFEEEMQKYLIRIFGCDGVRGVDDLLGDEKPISLYENFISFGKKPRWYQKLLSKKFSLQGEKRISKGLLLVKNQSAYQYNKITGNIIELREKIIQFLDGQNIDAVLCPSSAIPAGKPKFTQGLSDCLIYLQMFNVLNFPAGVVPVTVVKKEEQYYEDQHNDMLTRSCKDQMKGTEGLPIGVQVVSYPMQEEIVCNIMKQIEKEAQFHSKYPYKY